MSKFNKTSLTNGLSRRAAILILAVVLTPTGLAAQSSTRNDPAGLQGFDAVLSEKTQTQEKSKTLDRLLHQEQETSRKIDELTVRVHLLLEQRRRQKLIEIEQAKIDEANKLESGQAAVQQTGEASTSPSDAKDSENDDASPEGLLALPETTRVLEVPVDQLLLADSLYKAGEFAAALDIYLKVNDPNSETWTHFQAAKCLKHLGRHDEAARYFRNVVEAGGNEPWVDGSRWSLNHERLRQDLESEITTLQQFIQTRKGNADATDARDAAETARAAG